MKLKFSKGNAKLGKEIAIFSLPAGYTCPGALECLSRANKVTGKVEDGPHTKFRCYAASNEALFTNIRKGRWNNFNLLKGKSVQAMADLIEKSIPRNVKLVRIHASGDFFSQDYFDAWNIVARKHSNIIFYAYTKALNFWLERLFFIPKNLKLIASRGGRFDDLITKHNLRHCEVVFSEDEAKCKGLAIDHTDQLAYGTDTDFALLLHGTQPAGSEPAKAWYKMHKSGNGGYKAGYFDWKKVDKKLKTY